LKINLFNKFIKEMSARGSRSARSAPSIREVATAPPPVVQVASPTVASPPPVQVVSMQQVSSQPAAPPPNAFAAYDERYWQRSEIVPANFATKGDLAFYSLKTDLENYQTRGNYQMAGDYVLRSDLTAYQTRGNYQLAGAGMGDLNASNGYFRTFGARSAGGTVGNTNPDGAVGAVIGANIDNSWILHAPNDTRNTLFVAPGRKGSGWNWGKQMSIDKNGHVMVPSINSFLQGVNFNSFHPDNYDGSVYRADGQLQVAVDDLLRLRNTTKKDTGIQFDTRQGPGDMAGPNGIMKITRQGIIFGGPNDATKETNSAQISAGRHVPNSLNIVGMSADKNAATRKVDIWAEGGMTIRGPVNAVGNVNATNVAATGALTVAGKNIMNEINAIKAFVKMP
jgi:hypothetical protein